jgi:hypothetical protein
MAEKYFIPRQEADKTTWLQNFANKSSGYATKYIITTAEVDEMVAAALFYAYRTNYINHYNDFVRKLTQYRNELREGVPDVATASVMPTHRCSKPIFYISSLRDLLFVLG